MPTYDPNDHNLKFDFWNEIRISNGHSLLPWVLRGGGDFDVIFSFEDKKKRQPIMDDIRNASLLAQDLHLFEPLLVGRKFTG